MGGEGRNCAGGGLPTSGLPVISAPTPFSNRHVAHRDNRRAFPQCLRLHLSQRDQALSSPGGQGQPGTLCTNTTVVELQKSRISSGKTRRGLTVLLLAPTLPVATK